MYDDDEDEDVDVDEEKKKKKTKTKECEEILGPRARCGRAYITTS